MATQAVQNQSTSKGKNQLPLSKACEKSLESVAIELAYILTATESSKELNESAIKILQRGKAAISLTQSLKWSGILDQLVNNVKLCMFNFDLKEPLMRLSSTALPPESTTQLNIPAVTRHAIDLLNELARVLRGKEAFNLYRSVMMSDYPMGFHFLDLLNSSVLSVIRSFVDPYLLLRFIKSLILNSRTTLMHAEVASGHSFSYMSSSHAMAVSLEELILCLLNLHSHPVKYVNSDLVYQILVTSFQLIPLSKMSPRFVDRVNRFALDVYRGEIPMNRELVLNLLIEIIKDDYPGARTLVRSIMPTPTNQAQHPTPNLLGDRSLNHLNTFVNNIRSRSDEFLRNGTLLIIDLEMLTLLVEKYLTECRLLSLQCFKLILFMLDHIQDYEKNLFDGRSKSIKPKCVQGDDSNKIYVYEIDKIGKLVRAYHPSRKFLDELNAKTGKYNLCMYIFRQALHFIESLVHQVGRGDWPDTLENSELISSVVDGVRHFLTISNPLIFSKCVFIGQGTLDCLAAIGNDLYNRLHENAQEMCLKSSLLYATHKELVIRIKAGRCIGIYLEFENVAQAESWFILEALDAIERNLNETDVESTNIYTWAFANFTSILCMYYQGVLITNEDPENFVHRLRTMCHKCLKNSKGAHNAYRALGNIFLWAPTLYLSSESFKAFLMEAIEVLTKQIGVGRDYKARWNACYALGNVLRNTALIEFQRQFLMPPILSSLTRCLTESESVKEKSHCLTALQKIENREHLADSLQTLWECLFRLIEEDFVPAAASQGSHFEAKEDFFLKVGQCMAHFISLMDKTDFRLMNDLLTEHSDALMSTFGKLKEDIKVSDQLVIVDNAFYHLMELNNDKEFAKTESVELLIGLLDTAI